MKKRCEGFILFMTLAVILLISMLLMTSMQHILFYHKALNSQELQQQNFYQLEAVALQLAADSGINKLCLILESTPNQVIQKLLHQQGCLLGSGSEQYRYFIEDLGVFPCLVLSYGSKKRATQHFRITVLALIKEELDPAVMQLRFIKSAKTMKCTGLKHTVSAGLSSWRYLPGGDPSCKKRTQDDVPEA